MDIDLADRLVSDADFEKEIAKVATNYLKLGRDSLDYWASDFDVSYDVLNCYAPLTADDYKNLSRGHPKRFTLPMSSTQITTMATYIAQTLFGQETPHKVEARGPEDEISSEYVNQLLRWNSEQQPTYTLGYLWVQDALVANRGIFYNYWSPLYGAKVVNEQKLRTKPDGTQETYWKPRRKQEVVGGYCRFDLISPYDFFCDPSLPLWKFQDGRFAGHRTTLTWLELERRSALSPDHPQYVLPSAVQKLKDKKKSKASSLSSIPTSGSPTTKTDSRVSRSQYERGRMASPQVSNQADKDDHGVIECFEMWIRMVPADYKIDDGVEPVIMQFLIAGDDTVLSINESTYAHGEFPYCVGEGRPNGTYQFSPSWMMMLKGIQDYVDWLKNRHQEALARTIGNIFIYNPQKVNIDDFMNPEKEGLLIPLTDSASSDKIDDCIKQVPIKDMTENFHSEMISFSRMSENVTGANTYMQGQTEGDASATEFAGTQQMAAGRLSSIARQLSTQALVTQTKQTVSNFQQFMEIQQAVRFTPSERTPEALLGIAALVINRDTIQGSFDYIPHDGTMPGTDGKKVAAISRLLESAAAFPDVFTPQPGNLNPRKLIFAAAKAAGVSIENFKYTPQDIPQTPPPMPGGMTPIGVKPPMPGGPGQPPGPAPQAIQAPTLPQVSLDSVGPPQPRPGQL
jgi:hypothetical protein